MEKGPESMPSLNPEKIENTMDGLYGDLIRRAMERHPGEDLFLPKETDSLKKCFTYAPGTGKLVFWYNTADHSTHAVMEE